MLATRICHANQASGGCKETRLFSVSMSGLVSLTSQYQALKQANNLCHLSHSPVTSTWCHYKKSSLPRLHTKLLGIPKRAVHTQPPLNSLVLLNNETPNNPESSWVLFLKYNTPFLTYWIAIAKPDLLISIFPKCPPWCTVETARTLPSQMSPAIPPHTHTSVLTDLCSHL